MKGVFKFLYIILINLVWKFSRKNVLIDEEV